MKYFFVVSLMTLTFNVGTPAKALGFGAEIPVLLKILANSVNQLYQLSEIVRKGRDSLGLMKDIHSGLDGALEIAELLGNKPDIKLYKEWRSLSDSLHQIRNIYGRIPKSSESVVQQNTDLAVAEAINLNNELFKFATSADRLGKELARSSRLASPKGASKLTAQGMGMSMQVMTQELRAKAAALKLQAQELAIKNHREKQETRSFKKATDDLSNSLKTHKPRFFSPRF